MTMFELTDLSPATLVKQTAKVLTIGAPVHVSVSLIALDRRCLHSIADFCFTSCFEWQAPQREHHQGADPPDPEKVTGGDSGKLWGADGCWIEPWSEQDVRETLRQLDQHWHRQDLGGMSSPSKSAGVHSAGGNASLPAGAEHSGSFLLFCLCVRPGLPVCCGTAHPQDKTKYDTRTGIELSGDTEDWLFFALLAGMSEIDLSASESEPESAPSKTQASPTGCRHLACSKSRSCIIEELKTLMLQYDRSGTDQFRRRVSSILVYCSGDYSRVEWCNPTCLSNSNLSRSLLLVWTLGAWLEWNNASGFESIF